MRDCSEALAAYVAANNIAFRADLLTLSLGNGSTYRWTTWNTDLTVTNYNRGDTQTFKARSEAAPATSAPIVDVGSENEDPGLSVCSLDITLSGQSFTIGGKSLMIAAADGLFDGAYVTLDHLIMPSAGDVSLQSFIDFEGRVSEPDIGVSEVTLRCKSWLEDAAAIVLPRRTYDPNCPWEHFGPECGLVRASYTTTGTVTVASGASLFAASTAVHNGEVYVAETVVSYAFGRWFSRSEVRGWWNRGVITWTGNVTAALAGVRSDVLTSDASWVFTLASPAPVAPAVGDTFSVASGCNQDSASCNRYANLARFGGFKFIPPNTSTPVR